LLSGAGVIASSYNEPLITSEWAVSVFRQAGQAGLKCVYISNGNSTPEVLEYLRPYLVGYKVDLKTMQDRQYRKLGGVLKHVLDTIRRAYDLGLWVEVVTLVIPGMNDSPEELMEAARFIASVSRDIPWHVTAYHPDYQMSAPPTTARKLIQAAEIGQEAGLNFVYAGNLSGRTGEYEHTLCPQCQSRLVERTGYVIEDYRITASGACPKCGKPIAGIWTGRPETVKIGGIGLPRLVR
jgi:pyruvate formate lyase activating enzyme